MPEHNDIELSSEEVQDILTRVPHWMIRWGNFVILLVLFSMMFGAYFIKYPDIVTTQVIITTQNPPGKLVARTSGKIAEILITDRTEVKPKTALAIIENTANYIDVFRLKKCVDSLSLNTEQFNFPFENFSALQLGEIQNAFTLFEKDYIAYDFNRDLQPYSVEKTAQGLETSQLKERLLLTQQQYQISQNELQLKKQELERFKKLYDKGVIATQEWESKNLDFLQSEKNVRNIGAQLSQMRSSINDLKRNTVTTRINESKDNINLLRNLSSIYNY